MFGWGNSNNGSASARNTSHTEQLQTAYDKLNAVKEAAEAKLDKIANLHKLVDEVGVIQNKVDAEFEKLFARL